MTFVVIACGLDSGRAFAALDRDLYFARDLEVANAYTSYFRTTSLFADSSLYARQLVIAIVIVVAALWLGRVRLWSGAAVIALLWAGLFFSYSQSSMVALAVAALALSLVLVDRTGRRLLVAGALLVVVVAVAALVTTVHGDSAQRFTSGRSALVQGAWNVFVDDPLVGVGIGAQPEASRADGGRKNVDKNASHTTPLTVAAELGVVGLVAYVAFLAGAARLAPSHAPHQAGTRPRAERSSPPLVRALALLQRLLRGPAYLGHPGCGCRNCEHRARQGPGSASRFAPRARETFCMLCS